MEIEKLFKKQQAVLTLIGMREAYVAKLDAEAGALAARHGTSKRTLYRWEDEYLKEGLSGLMRGRRSDKGQSRTMCEAAKRYLNALYFDKARISQQVA